MIGYVVVWAAIIEGGIIAACLSLFVADNLRYRLLKAATVALVAAALLTVLGGGCVIYSLYRSA